MPVYYPIAQGDIIAVNVFCRLEAHLSYNVLFAEIDAGFNWTDSEEMTRAIADGLEPLYIALMSNRATFYGVATHRQLPGPPTTTEFIFRDTAGDESSDPLPPQTCGLFTRQGVISNRRQRGRMYVPFPPESLNDTNGEPDVAYQSDLQDLGDMVVGSQVFTDAASANAGTLKWKVFSGMDGQYYDVSNARIRRSWATQRRRSGFGGVWVPFP